VPAPGFDSRARTSLTDTFVQWLGAAVSGFIKPPHRRRPEAVRKSKGPAMNPLADTLDAVCTRPEHRPPVHLTPAQPVPASTGRRLEDRQFELMNQVFTATGGLVDGNALAGQLRRRWDQPISRLARAIVARQVVSITWRSQWLLPMFQFDPHTLAVREPVTQVIAELGVVFDDWELALWFAQPNAWLDDRAPARLIGSEAKAVHEAARADRFIARS
jgi:hypothetical protein